MKIWITVVLVALINCDDYNPSSGKGILLTFLQNNINPCICRCGISNRGARLTGGEYTQGYEFPWLASIQLNNFSFSATLINSKYVVTAASGLIGITPPSIKVTFAQNNRCYSDVTSINVSVNSIIIHEEFDHENKAHDIALLKLAIPIRFDKRISPICLSNPFENYENQIGTVVSWFSNNEYCRPRKIRLQILNHDECIATATDSSFVTGDKGCLGVIGSSTPICKEDAGSPVMYRSSGGSYELIGVLTDQNQCNDLPSTALYTKIDDHLQWIVETTKDACYCLKI